MEPWYKEGLPFKCTGCGQCCTGSPGYVWISDEEAQALADALQIPFEEFTRKYTRRVGNRISLKEHPRNFDCVFLEGKKCKVYAARPQQCRTFPWWKENLETPEHWKEAGLRCEGINHPEAPLISLSDIEKGLT